ncbi:helix-turn-helix domain-containing protein [Vallitalea guaymasensis]|uniref:helix-turn-helix domain-containing protein n=1 Tax=Vallitalea guaymasensis TaxID=1185412 RepID=UPI00272A0735|nr:helix-turn-helix domain-containing protein [Vallitalea guaymasensis]
MENKFYTVDQVAEMLKIHPKTVRKYVREGKLRGTKVGKQWRVTGHDLSLFMEGQENIVPENFHEVTHDYSVSDNKSNNTNEKISVSTVIDIVVKNRDEVDRISNTLVAVMNSKDPEYGNSTINIQYIEKTHKLRVMLWGTIYFTETLLNCISVLTDNND